ncbi:DnaJ-domain-containing protein [Calocera viscosa TUFC12733]|uniref:DnaJ-domain-containing protein n=1 Tax=Calocera viscosa (strain TUFC12733) TaxID=1330018 RepID=A0A167P232_CALVF|nr:DnaJ-domain-containing protein [Calocera viscosa TUFC12733]
MSAFVNYYELLRIERTSTAEQIRTAYKKESLRTHPDRLPPNASPSERQTSTARFQAVADAYYVLSDPVRRRDYDALLASRKDATAEAEDEDEEFAAEPEADASRASWSSQQPNADNTFTSVFEDLLRPEVESHVPWWTWIGSVSGAGLGYIVANVPGAMMGAYAGNRLGKIRDAKGKSVAEVFSGLGGNQKAQILKALAMKILGSTMQ